MEELTEAVREDFLVAAAAVVGLLEALLLMGKSVLESQIKLVDNAQFPSSALSRHSKAYRKDLVLGPSSKCVYNHHHHPTFRVTRHWGQKCVGLYDTAAAATPDETLSGGFFFVDTNETAKSVAR